MRRKFNGLVIPWPVMFFVMDTDKDALMKHQCTVIPGLLHLLLAELLIKLPQGDLHYLFHQTHSDTFLALTSFSILPRKDSTKQIGQKMQSIQLAAEKRTETHARIEFENQFRCNSLPCPDALIIKDALQCCEQSFKWDLSRSGICEFWKDMGTAKYTIYLSHRKVFSSTISALSETK